jgi:MerR family transcriptional regulator, light-induced transcriptional regulator
MQTSGEMSGVVDPNIAADGSACSRFYDAGNAGLAGAQALSSACGSDMPSHHIELIECIRTRVIPQLARTHGVNGLRAPASARVQIPTQDELVAFSDLVIREDTSAVVAFTEALLAEGVPIETVYLDWIAAAARQMGCDWASDRTDFGSVTIGMWKLQQVMHSLSPTFLSSARMTPSPSRALLASAPGDQHTFGIGMLSEFFRRAGWEVWTELPADYEEVVGKARDEWFDLIGLSAGQESAVEPMARAIAGLRRASRNPKAVIMVGGAVFTMQPETALRVGADFTAPDARQAVAKAQQAVSSRLSEQFRR